MSLIQALILGIVQGLTEFLPVSSSAHLVLIPHLLGWQLNDEFVFSFDVLVQIGTLLALLIYSRDDLKEIFISVINGLRDRQPFKETPARVGWLAVLATIPAGLFGLFIKDKVEAAFTSPIVTAGFLILTAGLLILAEYIGKRSKDLEQLTWVDAIWIGSFQAISIFPGISRSGSTITGGMTRNLKRKVAGQFSFIMAIPVFLAAGLLGVKDLLEISNFSRYLPVLVVGFFSAAVVGYFAIRWLLTYISSHSLLPFAGYCLMFGAASIAFTILNPKDVQPNSSNSSTVFSNKPVPVSQFGSTQVAISPELEWLLPAMVSCQESVGWQDMIISQETDSSQLDNGSQINIGYGEQKSENSEAFLIGSDSFNIVVNPKNTLTSLSVETAASIFTGKMKTWDEITKVCPDCFSGSSPSGQVNIYAYVPGSYLDQASRTFVMEGQAISTQTRIAPDSRSIRTAINQDEFSLGILPSKWIDDNVLRVNYSVDDKDFNIPILAYLKQPLHPMQQTWLSCIQERIR